MKTFWIGFGIALVAACALEWSGAWWAMPIAGALAGYWIRRGRQSFLAGALGVALAWTGFLALAFATSPAGALLQLFMGIVELDASLAFVPVVLAVVVGFLLGGLGGLTGACLAQLRPERKHA